MAIAAAIYDALQARKMTQKDFAKLMGKQESEISKWLSGRHNFTLKTIVKIELELGVKLLKVVEHPQADTQPQETTTEATAREPNR